jgi:hypothetical protein
VNSCFHLRRANGLGRQARLAMAAVYRRAAVRQNSQNLFAQTRLDFSFDFIQLSRLI